MGRAQRGELSDHKQSERASAATFFYPKSRQLRRTSRYDCEVSFHGGACTSMEYLFPHASVQSVPIYYLARSCMLLLFYTHDTGMEGTPQQNTSTRRNAGRPASIRRFRNKPANISRRMLSDLGCQLWRQSPRPGPGKAVLKKRFSLCMQLAHGTPQGPDTRRSRSTRI
jgi:hypothetical protein